MQSAETLSKAYFEPYSYHIHTMFTPRAYRIHITSIYTTSILHSYHVYIAHLGDLGWVYWKTNHKNEAVEKWRGKCKIKKQTIHGWFGILENICMYVKTHIGIHLCIFASTHRPKKKHTDQNIYICYVKLIEKMSFVHKYRCSGSCK